ncbi:dTDP-4-amino-4,6-dideoxygalactose transaminase [Ilumatobacter sp.]|uniref:dTDP-4-amino-4,6-dideoxygalactose transaminase n=1 Tax=Ilumatobacter sp. TaxID=1967498 RepID=UPI003C612248
MIRFNQPGLVGAELDYLAKAVADGHTSSSGPFSERASSILCDALSAPDVALTTSCTDALELTAMLLDLGPDDTVIVPSFTFTSTALAFARQGARIRFADIEPKTLGIDPEHVAELIDESVRAVVVVHYAGVPCDLDGIQAVLAEHPEIELIEDNAHGLFATHRDQALGTFGRFATLSFHETKNFICGEGGALIINDEADISRAHTLIDKGTNRREFLLGNVDKYSWRDTGSSFGLSDLLAAYLVAQLEGAPDILSKRAEVTERYTRALAPVSEALGLQLPHVPEHGTSAHHMFYVLLPTSEARNDALAAMKARGVQATFHYVPLHSSEAGRRFSDSHHECPVTDDVSGRLLRLPYYNDLTVADQDHVIEVFIDAAAATA